MTIVVGFQCWDGIVIAADRLLSAEGSHKFNETKILSIRCMNSVFYLAYSGLPVLAKEAQEKLTERLNALDNDIMGQKVITSVEAKECIEGTLVEMSQQRYDKMILSLLVVGIYQNRGTDFWIFNETGFHTVWDFELLGVGDSSLIRYFQKLYSPKASVSLNERLAIFLVEKAKEHIDGCGGQTDVLTIKLDKQRHDRMNVTQVPEETVKEIAAEMNRRERALFIEIIEPKPSS